MTRRKRKEATRRRVKGRRKPEKKPPETIDLLAWHDYSAHGCISILRFADGSEKRIGSGEVVWVTGE